ncbi:CD63 antigen-like [Leptopilina boulardi]|uniref:CD63 antigen-like n=1 Tax=Leptopilina boulardi TaxID=63433 RepID=UPI0021F59422|nr:CD63 antigen-like [Leptopilina boulardi]
MAELCGIQRSKFYLLVYNIIFLLSGITVLVVGGYITNDVVYYGHFMEPRLAIPPVVLVIAGIIVFISASCGCFGTVRESFTFLMVFCIGLLMIFIMELAVGVTAWSYRKNFSDIMSQKFTTSMYDYKEVDVKAWDVIQEKLQCCGRFDFKDWYVIEKFRNNKTFPLTCCMGLNAGESCSTLVISKIHDMGCFSALDNRVKIEAIVLICIGILIAIVELFGISLSCRFATSIRRRERAKFEDM